MGSFLLMLPQAVQGLSLGFVDALFTATSAVCVTGLTVVDTGTRFTFTGQIIILVLIQLGGLGIMTLSTFFISLIVGQFSILQRDVIQETLTQKPMKNLASLLKIILFVTLIVELAGAIILTVRFLSLYPLKKAFFFGIFHAISAFCNAGFALFSNSFMDFKHDYVINFVVMILIVLGGLGFIVFLDIKQCCKKKNYKEISFHSKLVFLTTGFLIVWGAVNFLLLEFNNVLEHQSLDTKILASFFQSITARTAGFNTVDTSRLTNVTLFFLINLMFIGASPGSCGGGIKTTTFSVLFALLVARFRNRREVNIFNRSVPEEILSRAISITFFSIIVIVVFTMTLVMSEMGDLSHQESRGMFLEYLFEVVSAFGTVGLSTGITPNLSTFGKVLISILMFIGRLGPLTIALAIGIGSSINYRYAKEKFLVG